MIKVLIIDDSAVIRKILTQELSKFDDIEIVGTAVDPYVARDKIVKLKPDVITLDLEMPRMDGLSFLVKLMKYFPMPVVVLSSLTPKNSELAMKALELGAVDVLAKTGTSYSTSDISIDLVRAIRGAASARLNVAPEKKKDLESPINYDSLLSQTTDKIVAIGASTGGTKAIEAVLTRMPRTAPGTVIVQHMPEQFTATFAQRLNEICEMEVCEAKNNDRVTTGKVLIAPGNQHMLLYRSGSNYMVKIKDGPRVHYQRPSVDVLFQSVATHAGKNAVGAILTGMGADGAKGMLEMRKNGAYTIAQDEKSCIVFGMPKEAIKMDAVNSVVPLDKVAKTIITALNDKNKQMQLKQGEAV